MAKPVKFYICILLADRLPIYVEIPYAIAALTGTAYENALYEIVCAELDDLDVAQDSLQTYYVTEHQAPF